MGGGGDDTVRCKEGMLEKYSISGSLSLFKNWKERYMRSTPEGLFYSTTEAAPRAKGFVPYGFDTTLWVDVDESVHPEAQPDEVNTYHYFAIQFVQANKVKMLLLRTRDAAEKDDWCQALGTLLSRAD